MNVQVKNMQADTNDNATFTNSDISTDETLLEGEDTTKVSGLEKSPEQIKREKDADLYFQDALGKVLSDFIKPLSKENPCGEDLRETGLFPNILEARRADDPNLPRGDWQIELKRADWKKVSELTSNALLFESKDLQLCCWFMEAEMKQRGFASIAPCLMVVQSLLEQFWQQINPPIEEFERRYNLFRWMDEKLPLVINQISIAVSLDESEIFTGANFDRAQEQQYLIETKKIEEKQIEGLSLRHVMELVARTPSEFYTENYTHINNALIALELLDKQLDKAFGRSEAPGVNELRSQLQRSFSFIEEELDKRGILDEVKKQLFESAINSEDTVSGIDTDELAGQTEEHQATTDSTETLSNNPVMDRQNAYQQLTEIAHYLANIEPHSPVPYLVMRAVEWGAYNTAELYEDLFLVNKGQIDLFEIMGITAHQEQANASA